ncbi:hypothetical protein FG93_01740 [Bosea sp. LC85]|uniref:hypothetical protein n=1 Tax=Bosea sp. LC85 TaxID=1502851 RepID=UPI0004E300AC|nr:hypothetical protein [Bosea sp. LC85]KFC73372.1 hypothetical protein FG93_01740 [Bosea sp. LC85]
MTAPAMRALAVDADERLGPTGKPPLSTDYLNRYGEALMLIEMVPMDRGIIEELRTWRAVGYREHFQTSRLRCAPEALAAYDQLDACQVEAFEQLCRTMSQVIATATGLLGELDEGEDVAAVVEVAAGALRSLIGHTTLFINVNGQIDTDHFDVRSLQDNIDALFAN